jgi:RNA polymerase sigma-70 factor (ECF subfamily)
VRAERRLTPLEDENMEHGGDGGPASALERKEEVTRVGVALGALTPREREILWLKVDGALSYKEIALVMKLSVSNVGFILHGAIAKLRKELAHAEGSRRTLLERTP